MGFLDSQALRQVILELAQTGFTPADRQAVYCNECPAVQLRRNRQALTAQPGLNLGAVSGKIIMAGSLAGLEAHRQSMGRFNPVFLKMGNMQAGAGYLKAFQ
ncbi:hypothetical protein D3C80_1927380 [compost metagenome]